MRSLYGFLRLALEGDHDAVAGTRRLTVERGADEGGRVLALEAIARPAAVEELALVANGAEDRVVEGHGLLNVQRADRDIADHVVVSLEIQSET